MIRYSHAMSSSAASTTSAALSKTKAKHAGALSRNEACRTCRRRKVKCDAKKPGCSACCRSANAQGKDPMAVVCEYDDEAPATGSAASSRDRDTSFEEPASKRSRISPPTNSEKSIQELERQIADLQNQIKSGPASGNNGLPSASGNGGFQVDWLGQTAMSSLGMPMFSNNLYAGSKLPDSAFE